MSSLKTYFTVLCMALLVPAHARAGDDPPVRFFAECAGRMSASVEHAWLTGADDAPLRAQRDGFADIIAALTEPASRVQVMDWRIRAKMDHKRLLSVAVFSDKPRLARLATIQARAHVSRCGAVLLG